MEKYVDGKIGMQRREEEKREKIIKTKIMRRKKMDMVWKNTNVEMKRRKGENG